ncbi:hypothetical protein C9I57_11945 [Trinickia symbiotica]|uniref:diguanylate cyclase n=1 Tax=Trinickia symbiotica TaxID=863227 RepID=A0A2T3XVK4_9BURK|nr:diguanylate cyclase [Trinickia symbiotica]PTB20544.1 hypothetical protein C9I57_11945 [Trinickia symbiotica]
MESLLIGPATRKQAACAGTSALLVLLALAIAAPQARQPLSPVGPFMPMCALTVFTTSGIAAFLLGARFAATQRPMLCALGGAYAFTAITVALQLLMFPGVFSHTGLLGARPNSAAWMWVFWHGGFPLLVATAMLMRDQSIDWSPAGRFRFHEWILTLIGMPALLAAVLGVFVANANLSAPFYPMTGIDSPRISPTALVVCLLDAFAIVLVLVKGRLRSVLDLWITIALLASFVDASLNMLSVGRFTVGWYVARVFSMLAPGVLVGVLIWEVTVLYRQLAEAHASLLLTSTRDALTGVYNRNYFDEHFRRDFDRARLHRRPLSLVMIDIDNFKAYNDAFGHLRGDACLRAVAEALARTAGRAGEYVARYGGEEFVIVLPGSDLEAATRLAEQARNAVIGIGLTAPGPGGRVTVSAGCACSDGSEPSNASELLGAADAALYAAKRAGRNRVERVAVIDRG